MAILYWHAEFAFPDIRMQLIFHFISFSFQKSEKKRSLKSKCFQTIKLCFFFIKWLILCFWQLNRGASASIFYILPLSQQPSPFLPSTLTKFTSKRLNLSFSLWSFHFHHYKMLSVNHHWLIFCIIMLVVQSAGDARDAMCCRSLIRWLPWKRTA